MRDAELRVKLFGRFEIWREGVPIPSHAWPQRKTQLLLKFLVSERGRFFTQDQLIDALFSDLDPEKAARSLRGRISELRKVLEPDLPRGTDSRYLIHAGLKGYCFSKEAPCSTDTEVFPKELEVAQRAEESGRWVEALRGYEQAVAIYQGDYLAEDLYEEWTTAPRERWRELYLKALARLAECYARLRQLARALECCQRVLEKEPWHEGIYRQKMLYHYHAGEHSQALQTYQTCVEALKAHLAVEPSLETIKLHEQIRKHEVPALPQVFPNNLPQPMTSFIGREREILEIKRLVMHVGANGRSPLQRLITLTGPGGCGKTRLALEVASELLKEYEDGAWLVELAAISNPALVPQTIAASLGVREKQGQTLMDSLIDHLRTKKLLLVLDNCEHLIPACAQVAERFLRACPDLQILTTSRESLGISGESIWQVPPLWMPTAPKLPPLKILKQYEAVSLFVERALACQPEFVLTRQNAAAVAQVCQQLDGMPLAIELAAARVRALSVQEIATRLGDRFALLTGGSRTAPARHQTLQAAMDWSFSLLAEPERILLRRLSVFAGGFTLEAAESVCADDPTSNGGSRTASMEVLDLLTQLVEKSLVVAQPSTQTRYRLLETVREYGAAKLEAARELPTFQSRHRDYYLALAERAEPELRGAQQAAWLEQLEKEHGNLRASLEWSLRSKDTETGLRLAGALVRFWQFRGYLSEARQYLERILSQSSSASASARAKALNGTGIVMLMQGDYGPAKAYLEEALVLLRAQGDQKGIADVLHNLANVAWDQGDYAKVRALCAESLAIRQEIGDTLGIAASLTGLGNIAYALGDYAEAQVLFEKSLAHVKAIGDPLHIAITLHNLGNVAMKQGDYKRARTFHEESLAIKRELGDKLGIGYTLHSLGEAAFQLREYDAASTYFAESLSIRHALGDKRSVALSLEAFAMLAIAQWQPERAAQLTGAAEALRESIGAPLAPAGRADYDHTVAAAREGLGEKAFASVWAEGRTMTLEQAIEYALKAS